MNSQKSFLHQLVVPFVIIMILVSGYFVYRHNPEIMNTVPFVQVLANQAQSGEYSISEGKTSEVDSTSTKEMSHPQRVSHRFVELKSEEFLPLPINGKEAAVKILSDRILVQSQDALQVFDTTGKLLWRLVAPEKATFFTRNLNFHKNKLMAVTTDGQIFTLALVDGKLLSYRNLNVHFVASPLLFRDELVLFIENADSKVWSYRKLNLENDELGEKKGKFELPLTGEPTLHSDGVFYFATQTGQLQAVDLKEDATLWTVEGSSGFNNSPSQVGERLYMSNEDGFLNYYDRRSGKKIGEIELESRVAGPISIVEGTTIGVAVDMSGYLIAFDTKSQKRVWRYNLNMNQGKSDFRLFRLSDKSLNELTFASAVRGWTVWVPCNQSRICVFDLKEGQMLYRIDIKGEIMGAFHIWNVQPEDRLLVTAKRGNDSAVWAFIPYVKKTSETVSAQAQPPPTLDK